MFLTFYNWHPIMSPRIPLNRTVIWDNDVSRCWFQEWTPIWIWTLICVYHIYQSVNLGKMSNAFHLILTFISNGKKMCYQNTFLYSSYLPSLSINFLAFIMYQQHVWLSTQDKGDIKLRYMMCFSHQVKGQI